MDRQFGPWIYSAASLTLEHERTGYEIYLRSIKNSASMLDWIFQIHNKSWCDPSDMADLITALDCIFAPQAHLCSNGEHLTIDPVELLAS